MPAVPYAKFAVPLKNHAVFFSLIVRIRIVKKKMKMQNQICGE